MMHGQKNIKFITVFTTARYLSLACDKFNPVQAVPHFCFKYHSIQSFHPDLSSDLSLSLTFHHQNQACIFTKRATCSSSLIVLSHHSNNHS